MEIAKENLFFSNEVLANCEKMQILLQTKDVRIEKIESNNYKSAKDFWYEQDKSEWVCLLEGEAKIQFQADERIVKMKKGDSLLILPKEKHKVAETSQKCIWLAFFF